jgi:hypothetical protein
MLYERAASMAKKDLDPQAKGGLARAEALTSEERTDIARKAALTRWSPDIPRATHEGTLHIGSIAIPCAVLENGQRVLTQSGLMLALGRARQAKGRDHYEANVNMPAFLTAKNLAPFISKELETTSSQIEFRTVRGARAFGYPADLLPKVCDVFLDADEAGALAQNQKHIVTRAKILIRGLAHVGIVALVDEATGYQEIRDRLALQAILDRFLRKELAAWAKRFPDEFYQQIFRLRGWNWKGMRVNRPQVMASYTKDFVYERLAPGILKELEARNPKDVGHPALAQHLYAVIGLMRVATSWEQFKAMLNRAFPKKGTTLFLPHADQPPASG